MALLQKLRDQTSKTQEQVAAELEIHVRTVIRHETGETRLRPMHRTMYANYFGVTPDSIEQPERDEVAA